MAGLNRRQLIAGGAFAALSARLVPTRARAETPGYLPGDQEMLQIVALNGVDPPLAARVLADYALVQHDLHADSMRRGSDVGGQAADLPWLIAALHLPAGTAISEDGLAPEPRALGGRDAAAIVARLQERRRGDGARFDDFALCHPPEGIVWQSPFNRPGVRPGWGRIALLLANAAELAAPEPPPPTSSPSLQRQLAMLEQLTNNASAADREMVRRYGYPTGTITPAGYWLEQVSKACMENRLNLGDTLFARAVAMCAVHDATVCCWRLKYQYWYPRPSQLNPAIRPIISVPNFPSFTSGHASMSGAASRVIEALVPAAGAAMAAHAAAAAHSRVVGGIHFDFDSSAGLEQGRRVADSALRACRQATAGRTPLCELVSAASVGEELAPERAEACRRPFR